MNPFNFINIFSKFFNCHFHHFFNQIVDLNLGQLSKNINQDSPFDHRNKHMPQYLLNDTSLNFPHKILRARNLVNIIIINLISDLQDPEAL